MSSIIGVDNTANMNRKKKKKQQPELHEMTIIIKVSLFFHLGNIETSETEQQAFAVTILVIYAV